MAAREEFLNSSMNVDSCQSSNKGDMKDEKLKKMSCRTKRPDLQVYVPRGRRQEQPTEVADLAANMKCAMLVPNNSDHKVRQNDLKIQSSSKSRLVGTSNKPVNDNLSDCQALQGNTVVKSGKQSKTHDVKANRRKHASKEKLSQKVISVSHESEPLTSTPCKSDKTELVPNTDTEAVVEICIKSFSQDESHSETGHFTNPCGAGVTVPNSAPSLSEENALDLPALGSCVACQSELDETRGNNTLLGASHRGILENETCRAEFNEEVNVNAASKTSENDVCKDNQLISNSLWPDVIAETCTNESQYHLENELCAVADVALGRDDLSQGSLQHTSVICHCKLDNKIPALCDSLRSAYATDAHVAPLSALSNLTEKACCNAEVSAESSSSESANGVEVKLAVPADLDSSMKGEDNRYTNESLQHMSNTMTACAIDDDDWDHIYDDSGNSRLSEPDLDVLSKHGRVTSAKPLIDYYAHQPNDPDISNSECGHLIEIYDFPHELQTCDLLAAFLEYRDKGFDIKWVDDNHAIGVFSSSIAANSVLGTFSNPMMKVRSIESASRQTKLKAKRTAEFLQPYKARPETTATVARNLVAGALGLQNRVSREKREEERRKLKEAKERKREVVKLRDDAWDGNIVS